MAEACFLQLFRLNGFEPPKLTGAGPWSSRQCSRFHQLIQLHPWTGNPPPAREQLVLGAGTSSDRLLLTCTWRTADDGSAASASSWLQIHGQSPSDQVEAVEQASVQGLHYKAVQAAHAAGRLCGGFIALGPHDVMFFHCAGGLLQVAYFKIIMNHSHSAIFNNENALGGRARPPGSLLYRAEALDQGVLRKHLSSFDKVHLGFENSIVPDIDEYGVRLLGRVGETSDIVC